MTDRGGAEAVISAREQEVVGDAPRIPQSITGQLPMRF